MIVVRCWKEEAADTHLKLLVDSLLEVYQNFDKDNDVRKLSEQVFQKLQRKKLQRNLLDMYACNTVNLKSAAACCLRLHGQFNAT